MLRSSDADPDDDQAARGENDLLQPRQRLHQRARAEKARQPQRDVEENNDQRREIDAAALLRECAVDDKEVLQPDRGHIRQPHRQSLQIYVHFPIYSFFLI